MQDQETAYRKALSYLTRRDHSQHELTQKLKTKKYAPDIITAVVTRLLQAGYLNDKRFAEIYLNYRRAKGYGPNRIMEELKIRGIKTTIIAELIDITDNAWFTEAQKVWHKHFKGKTPNHFADWAKQMRFLQYRGYTREQMEQAVPAIDARDEY